MLSQRSYDHSNLLLLFETTIKSYRYAKKLEDDKPHKNKWREKTYGTAGNQSPEQQRACGASVFPTTKQPTSQLRRRRRDHLVL